MAIRIDVTARLTLARQNRDYWWDYLNAEGVEERELASAMVESFDRLILTLERYQASEDS